MKKVRDVHAVCIHTEICNDELCIRIVCDGIGSAAVCDEIVAHHVECRLGRIGADALGSNAVVGAGNDDTRAGSSGMPFPCDADVADEGITQPPKCAIRMC